MPIALKRYRRSRVSGIASSATVVPLRVIWWYRFADTINLK